VVICFVEVFVCVSSKYMWMERNMIGLDKKLIKGVLLFHSCLMLLYSDFIKLKKKFHTCLFEHNVVFVSQCVCV
jgi:hypothetical protein